MIVISENIVDQSEVKEKRRELLDIAEDENADYFSRQ